MNNAKSKNKLTKRFVDTLRPGGRDVIYFDAEIPRFGVRVKPSGVKSYVIQYRNKFGRLRRFTLGRVGDLTPEQARTKALKLRAGIADGADPSAERRETRNAITVAELCDEYLKAGAGRIKTSTLAMDKSRISSLFSGNAQWSLPQERVRQLLLAPQFRWNYSLLSVPFLPFIQKKGGCWPPIHN